MKLAPDLVETLDFVAEVMGLAVDDWWVIASAAAALHGVSEPPVADVDVLLSDADALVVLKAIGVEPLAGSPHPLFRSRILGRWTETPLAVEFMAGFHFREGDIWRPVLPQTREVVALSRGTVFVPSREELAEMLTLIGRPKDRQRARVLAAP